MQRFCIFLLVATLFSKASIAQTILPTGQKEKWSPDDWHVKLNDNEMILHVALDKNSKGFVRTDDKGGEKWRLPMESKNQVIGLARHNGNVLVLTANDESKKSWANIITKIYAVVMDPATGKTLSEKTIIQLPGNYVEPSVFTDEQGNLTSIIVRHTKWNGEATVFTLEKMETEKSQTPKLEVYAVSNDLTATLKHSYSFPDEWRLQNMKFNKNGELTVLGVNTSNQTLVMEQFANGNRKGMASTSFELPVKQVGNFLLSRMVVNPANSNEVYCVMSYDRKRKDFFVKVCRFDLSKSTANVQQIQVNGAYRELLEKNTIPPPNEKVNLEKRWYEYVTAVAVDIYKGKPVVITEIGADYEPASNRGSGSYIKSDAIITIYNPDLTVDKQFLMPKYLRSTIGSFGDGVAHKIDGNKLRLLANNQKGGNPRHSILYGEIDLDQLKWVKYNGARKDGLELIGDPVATYSTIWWPQHMLVTRRKQTWGDKIKDFDKVIPVSYE